MHQHLSVLAFLASAICLDFHLELGTALPLTPGTLPHSRGWVCAVLVTHGATRGKEITY